MDLSMKGAIMPADYTNKSSVATGTAKIENVDTKRVSQTQVSATKSAEVQLSAAGKEPVASAKTTAENQESTEPRVPDGSQIAKEIAEANRKLMFADRSFQYKVEDVTQRVVITVIDNNTKEVIKEIPPEQQVEALRKMWELAGLIVDRRI